MSLYDRAYGLLDIMETSSRFRGSRYRGGGGGGDGGGSNRQGWADKDMEGSSSVANRNRRIWNEQFQDKTRDAYERDQRKQITDELNGTNQTPLSEEQKKEREKRVDEEMKKYDKDPAKQRAAGEKYRPDLSSSELSRRRQNEEADARDAVRNYVKEQKDKGKDYDGDGKWTQADAKAARKEAEDKQKNGEPVDDETKAKTKEEAAKKEAEGKTGDQSTQQQINTINTTLADHNSRISALEVYRF